MVQVFVHPQYDFVCIYIYIIDVCVYLNTLFADVCFCLTTYEPRFSNFSEAKNRQSYVSQQAADAGLDEPNAVDEEGLPLVYSVDRSSAGLRIFRGSQKLGAILGWLNLGHRRILDFRCGLVPRCWGFPKRIGALKMQGDMVLWGFPWISKKGVFYFDARAAV